MTDLLDEYLDWLRICSRSQRTIDARREILGRIDHDLPEGLVRATAAELTGWIYRDHWSAMTRMTYYGAVKSFFAWATNPLDPKLDSDPSALLPPVAAPRGLPRPVSEDVFADVLHRAIDPYRRWAVLAGFAGLRCVEIALLDRQDVDEKSILLRRRKGGKPGVLPTHPMVWAAVRDLPPGPLALDDHGGRASPQWVSIRTALYFRRQLGLPGVGLHRMRHRFGTMTYRVTKDLRVTQVLMGHANPSTTAQYTLIDDEERHKAIAALPVPTGSLQANPA